MKPKKCQYYRDKCLLSIDINCSGYKSLCHRYKSRPRTCIDCGNPIARRTKLRCKNCHSDYLKTLVGRKNPGWKGEKASSVAINRIILNKLGNAQKCDNANCGRKSLKYVWVRLKSREGRRSGIWIQLCISCKVLLSNIYPHRESLHHTPSVMKGKE